MFLLNIIIIISFQISILCQITYDMKKNYVHKRTNSSKPNKERFLDFLDNNEISSIENGQFFYTIHLDIGSPPQFFEVLVDSSNEVTWVPSNKCKSCGEDVNAFIYPQRPKSEVKVLNDLLEITHRQDLFNNGNTLSGEILKGLANVHDLSHNLNITVKDMEILLVDKIASNFTDFLPGKLALTYSSRGNFDFITLLKNQGLIKRSLFAIAEEGLHGKLYIGDLPNVVKENMALYTTCDMTDNLRWFTKNERFLSGWVCELSHAYMGERTGLIKIHNDTKTTDFLEITGFAFFNTGSFVIKVPRKFFALIVENYLEMSLGSICTLVIKENEKFYTCPKEKVDFKTINPISFIIDGWAYEIHPYYLFVIADDIWSYEFLIRSSVGVENDKDDNIWHFGQPFFRQYITVFDKDNRQVGFYGGERLNFAQTYTVNTLTGNSSPVILEGLDENKSGSNWYVILLILLIIAGIVGGVYYKQKLDEKENERRKLLGASLESEKEISGRGGAGDWKGTGIISEKESDNKIKSSGRDKKKRGDRSNEAVRMRDLK